MSKRNWFITGIGTDVGKTVVSAVFREAFGADYWKPVQAGIDDGTDCETIVEQDSGSGKVHPETYRLKTPMSPHAAAAREGVEIDLGKFRIPDTENDLIVEGAGGLLVPLNGKETILDLIVKLQLPVVLVSRHYLGSINHTLLSIEMLRSRNVPIDLLVFIGEHPETESIIQEMSGIERIFKIPETDLIDKKFIRLQAGCLKRMLNNQ
ncbi:MAG: dethiobiotin synthase [Bacteroidetes bacterium]|nr:dethiobiotin synthase [Bacteroidota bacterium]